MLRRIIVYLESSFQFDYVRVIQKAIKYVFLPVHMLRLIVFEYMLFIQGLYGMQALGFLFSCQVYITISTFSYLLNKLIFLDGFLFLYFDHNYILLAL